MAELSQYSTIQQVYRDAIALAQREARQAFTLSQPRLMQSYETPFDEGLTTDALGEDERHMLSVWCKDCVAWLDDTMGKSVVETLDDIRDQRDKITCHQCGVCCRVASSEYTYEELLQQASEGDVFAEQFTRVFLPYASLKDLENRFPEVMAAMLSEVGPSAISSEDPKNIYLPKAQALHAYYCPYVGEDNRCTLYGNPKRPALCETYPENPLVFVQPNCAWMGWKQKHHEATITAHARLAVAQTYTERLNTLLEQIHPNL